MNQKPNIVYILADDMGYGDLSCLNPTSKIHTPHLDSMAATGMVFEDSHASSEIHYFAEKVAVVMKRDAVWETFADSLKRFGYVVIPTDCGLHSRAVMIQARDLLGRGVGLIVLSSLVTAERLLSEFEEVAEIKVFTFESGQRRLEFDGCDGVQFLEIDPAWLWKKDEGD